MVFSFYPNYLRDRGPFPHFWFPRFEEFKSPTSEEDHKGPEECDWGEAAKNVHGPINSTHFLMVVRATPNPLGSLNDMHLIKELQVFVLESSTTLTRKLNEAGGWGLRWSFWVA